MQQQMPKIQGYEVQSLIAKGAMGSVYKAIQTSLGRPVALKVLHPGLTSDPQLLARFEHEARLVASLSHPNIVSVVDFGVSNDTPFIAMQYVEGVTLQRYLVGKPLPIDDVVNIMRQVAEALDYAHSKGVIHRDIKPGNILVQSDGRVLLADFGIARSAGSHALTHVGSSLGTPAYMAPEVCRGEPATAASDVYSFGILLYEMLTGRQPFMGDDPMAVMYKHLNENLPGPGPATPIGVKQWPVVLRLVNKDPTGRPHEIAPMVNGLATGSGEVAESHPTPKPINRKKAVFLLGITAVLMCGVVAASVWNGNSGSGGGQTVTPPTPEPGPTPPPPIVLSSNEVRLKDIHASLESFNESYKRYKGPPQQLKFFSYPSGGEAIHKRLNSMAKDLTDMEKGSLSQDEKKLTKMLLLWTESMSCEYLWLRGQAEDWLSTLDKVCRGLLDLHDMFQVNLQYEDPTHQFADGTQLRVNVSTIAQNVDSFMILLDENKESLDKDHPNLVTRAQSRMKRFLEVYHDKT